MEEGENGINKRFRSLYKKKRIKENKKIQKTEEK